MESSLAWSMGCRVQMFREQRHLCRHVSLQSYCSARLHCNFTLWPIQVAHNHFLPRPPCHLTKLCRYSLISSSLMPSSVFWKFDPSPWQGQRWQHPRVSHSGVLLRGFLSRYSVLALWCHALHFPLSGILSNLQIHIILAANAGFDVSASSCTHGWEVGKVHALFPRRIFYEFNREYQLGTNTLIDMSQQVFTLPALWRCKGCRLQSAPFKEIETEEAPDPAKETYNTSKCNENEK